MRVAVIGLGYVGLTTGVALAYLGHEVFGVDKDANKLSLLNKRKSPIREHGIESMLAHVGERFQVTGQVDEAVPEADLIMIAVGTPPKGNGEADTCQVEDAARDAARAMQPGRSYTVAVKSTVPIGTHRRVARIVEGVLNERGVETQVYVASNPEFLQEGRALRDTFYPDRIVVGSDHPQAVEAMRRLYRPILEQTFDPPSCLPRPEAYKPPLLVTTDPCSAEVIKYAANAFLAVKISFINEIAGLCEKVGADVAEVARAIGLDPRIGPGFLRPGLGWGGSCLPKDTAALLAVGAEHGYTMPLVQAAREVNFRQRQIIVDKLQTVLKGLRGRTVAVFGLAFKPNTDDVREAPALDLIRLLVERRAHVRAHDPVALANARQALNGVDVEFVEDPYRAVEGADGVVLATEWDDYREIDLARLAALMKSPVLVDGRNLFRPEQARAAGFIYMGVGR